MKNTPYPYVRVSMGRRAACLYLLLMTFLASLFCGPAATARPVEVWESPATASGTDYGDGYFRLAIDVTRVEFCRDETKVYVTVRLRSDCNPETYNFRFSGDTHLQADGRTYKLLSVEGLKPDQVTLTGPQGSLDALFHFQPLPTGTTSFDFISGEGENAHHILGIMSVGERWKQLFPSYWRDPATGNWVLALLDEGAIWQGRFWTYRQRDVNPATGEARFVICCGDEEVAIEVGRNRKGRRTMHIDGQKRVLTMLTDRFLSDWPRPDTRTDFAFTGYRPDTVVLSGWLKDMPEHDKSIRSFTIHSENLFTGEPQDHSVDLDEGGRFTVRIPVLGSTEFFCDWGRYSLRTVLEPGQTYFLLYDYREGRRYFMGEDSRLQNELLKFPVGWTSLSMEPGEDVDHYTASVDSLLHAREAFLDSLFRANPSLSERFRRYQRDDIRWQLAFCYGQARFKMPDYRLTDAARKFAYRTFCTQLRDPLTLHRDIRTFLSDFTDDLTCDVESTWDLQAHLEELAADEEERTVVQRYLTAQHEMANAIGSATTQAEKERMVREWTESHADDIGRLKAMLNKPETARRISGKAYISMLKNDLRLLDSIGALPIVRDIFLTSVACAQMDGTCASLSEEVMDSLQVLIRHPLAFATVREHNDTYIAIENRKFDSSQLPSTDPLQGITEGETLLAKILEPLRGKVVLLDIWGTWCGPCKEALSHSGEQYARLAPYDVVFLYLANHSPADEWESVIKAYNVMGAGVVHYRLPEEQQAAIERYLNVSSFPTYKVFDQEGRLLDLNIRPHNLDALEQLVRQLSGQ